MPQRLAIRSCQPGRTAKLLVTLLATTALVIAACSSQDGSQPAGGPGTTTAVTTGTTGTTPQPGSRSPASTSGYRSDVYADPEHWLCRPELTDDICHSNLDATVVEANGSIAVERHQRSTDPSIDCFYVYPTISADKSVNSDLEAGNEEKTTVLNQAARFSSECRVFAPVYRQVTLGALFGSVTGDRTAAFETAYADVLDAWRHYLANDNDGRGIVLIGHSQGSGHLNRLLREEIEPNDDQHRLLVSALLLGSAVRVPPDADVGGDFTKTPLCRSEEQTGCVITYAAFRSTSPPPANSFFGRPRGGEGKAGCTNPASLAGGPAELDAYFPAGDWVFADPAVAASRMITTPFVKVPGLLRGECVERDGFSYLEVTVLADPTDPRGDDIKGDLTPEWGLHLVDANLAMGDLVRIVGKQAAAYSG
ncbi:MAG: DUF3089 domain-containing protein [Acidimicrobiales bacterium]|nr:DUF3089 domain-containing protein [Acidimicrobiales bacterium]